MRPLRVTPKRLAGNGECARDDSVSFKQVSTFYLDEYDNIVL